jgi:hypothetical protein
MLESHLLTWNQESSDFLAGSLYAGFDSGNLGARTGFVFAGSSVLLLLGVYMLVPDTTGLSTEDLDNFYEAKVPVRQFASHKVAMQA